MAPLRDEIGFPPNPSLDDVRRALGDRLARMRISLRVGAVATTDRNTIMAEVLDSLDTAVLFVEVDSQTGQTVRLL